MRDNGIAYGFSKPVLDETNIQEISPRVKSFIDENPGLLHEDADVSWLLENPDADTTSNVAADSEEEASTQNDLDRGRKRII